MINPGVIKVSAQAIVDYLGGNLNEFERLANMAMRLSEEEMTCSNCGGVQIPCRIGHKKDMKKGHICTECGQVIIHGEIYRKGKDLWRRIVG